MIRITWLDPVERVGHELRQLKEEGADTALAEAAWSELPASERPDAATRFLDDLAGLRAATADDPPPGPAAPGTTFTEDELRSRIRGGWYGRLAGCLLGKPVEKIPRAGIRAILESIGEWPLRQYFTEVSVPAEVLAEYPWNRKSRPTSLRENIVCMPEDDDVNYALLNLHVLEKHGSDFTTADVATAWLEMLPVLTTFTAERVAYQNLLDFHRPPETARRRNPYREWIGAQIRADVFGWVSPGDPAAAAAMAWRDARLSHTGNGIHAEVFVAALVSLAFVKADVRELITAALDFIPAASRFAEAIRFALSLPGQHADFERAVDALYAELGHYHWVHAINNGALLATALLYGEGDFSRTITLAVSGGWDTDSNGATAGSIAGVMNGVGAIPGQWLEPLRDTLRSSIKGFDLSSVTTLAERTVKLVDERYRP